LSFAQTRGKVEVVKDPLIDTLIARRPMLVKYTPGSTADASAPYNGYGFRVQIFFGSSRQAAYSAQERFRQDYPDYRTYISYTEPNFKVHVGDFRTRLEAQKLASQLNRVFTSLFIISEKISVPKFDAPND
jgi:hypothetical protein